jgi:hypothetical protein
LARNARILVCEGRYAVIARPVADFCPASLAAPAPDQIRQE